MPIFPGRSNTFNKELGTARFLIVPNAVVSVLYYDLANAPDSFWSKVKSDGGDIRITTWDGVQLPREVTFFNSGTKKGSLFIRATSGTSFYVYYGSGASEPAAISSYGKYAVWSEYATVWHCSDYNDSTAIQNTGAPTGMSAIGAGQIDDAWNDPGGASGYVDSSDLAALHGATKVTFSLWFKITTFAANLCLLSKWAYATAGTFGIQTSSLNAAGLGMFIATSVGDTGIGCQVTTAANVIPSTGVYHHLVVVFDGTQTGDANRLKFYVNGSPVTLGTVTGAVPAAFTAGTALLRAGGFSGTLTRYWVGGLDEIRIAVGTARDATWVTNEYANQHNVGAFWTTKDEEVGLQRTVNWTSTSNTATARCEHGVFSFSNGDVLSFGGNGGGTGLGTPLATSERWSSTTQLWAASGIMNSSRAIFACCQLADGRIFACGGYNAALSVVSSAEIYDPATGVWTAVTAPMHSGRIYHTATLLQDGRVLITGGSSAIGSGALSTAEIFDPVAGSFTVTTGAMSIARTDHTATLLPDGQVLVAGGDDYAVLTDVAETWNPTTGLFTVVGVMGHPRTQHMANLLSNGKVLIIGGRINSFVPSETCEIFDPGTGLFSSAASMPLALFRHVATTVESGDVLVYSGANGTAGTATVLLYSTAQQIWYTLPSLVTARAYAAGAMLPNGRVIIVGGAGSLYPVPGTLTTNCEVFQPRAIPGYRSLT